MPVNTEDSPMLENKQITVAKELNLSCVNEKSNKGYAIRLELSKNDTRAQIFSSWGKNENENWVQEWRWYDSYEKATKEFESIVKSKKKKGYEEV
jgi:predicted DNA-binding WGR domain protein